MGALRQYRHGRLPDLDLGIAEKYRWSNHSIVKVWSQEVSISDMMRNIGSPVKPRSFGQPSGRLRPRNASFGEQRQRFILYILQLSYRMRLRELTKAAVPPRTDLPLVRYALSPKQTVTIPSNGMGRSAG